MRTISELVCAQSFDVVKDIGEETSVRDFSRFRDGPIRAQMLYRLRVGSSGFAPFFGANLGLRPTLRSVYPSRGHSRAGISLGPLGNGRCNSAGKSRKRSKR